MLGFNALNPKSRNPKPTIVTVVARRESEGGTKERSYARSLSEAQHTV
jgi:hypothetical protein